MTIVLKNFNETSIKVYSIPIMQSECCRDMPLKRYTLSKVIRIFLSKELRTIYYFKTGTINSHKKNSGN